MNLFRLRRAAAVAREPRPYTLHLSPECRYFSGREIARRLRLADRQAQRITVSPGEALARTLIADMGLAP